ncbi:MAG: hypothetical protein M3Y24_09785 [Acidobacteriota bacterium]|nr:hypothetical protein [Acidobacteriota bacterium]
MRFPDMPPSPARLAANRLNAALSTGPKTEEGKAAVSQNNVRHGLTGLFMVLPWECRDDFYKLVSDLKAEHQPSTPTETLLVERMAQHHWLMQRAISLQGITFEQHLPFCHDESRFALYLRYQITHERAFFKCLAELAKLRESKRKSEIGFESQKRHESEEARKQSVETRKRAEDLRKEQVHQARVELLQTKTAAAKSKIAPAPLRTQTLIDAVTPVEAAKPLANAA